MKRIIAFSVVVFILLNLNAQLIGDSKGFFIKNFEILAHDSMDNDRTGLLLKAEGKEISCFFDKNDKCVSIFIPFSSKRELKNFLDSFIKIKHKRKTYWIDIINYRERLLYSISKTKSGKYYLKIE